MFVVDVADRAVVVSALADFGPVSVADLAATTDVGVALVRRVLGALAAGGRARVGARGWEAVGDPGRWEKFRQGGTLAAPQG